MKARILLNYNIIIVVVEHLLRQGLLNSNESMTVLFFVFCRETKIRG